MHDIDSILTTIFGLERFRPAQREIVADVLSGRDTLVVMPTGAGKSLCYQLPAVALRGLTLIISPLISLMADQVRQMRALRIPALMLSSAQTWDEQRAVMAKMREGFRGLLFVAPERFSAPGFLSIITGRELSLLAIDEAHCISQWGHDFRPEYFRLGEVRKQLGNPLTVALTATATPEVRKDIVRSLMLREPAIHVTGFDRPNLSYQSIVFAKAAAKDRELVDYLKHRKSGGIVYCSTRKQVEQVTALLEEYLRGRMVMAYHAGMDAVARESSQRRFIDGEGAIVVATNAFGMGINKPDLRFVIHYNVPGSLEAYYQEAGRAGRDGKPAECILYFALRDVMTQKFFIQKIGEGNDKLTEQEIEVLQRRSLKQLNAMTKYAEWERCRRRQIVEYFGERTEVHEDCTCDVCNAKHPKLKMTGRAAELAAGARPARSERGASMVRGASARGAERLSKGAQEDSRRGWDAPKDAPIVQPLSDRRVLALKQLRREVVRSLGLTFFQHLSDDVLGRLIAEPPVTARELETKFDLHPKIIERFGAQIVLATRGAVARAPETRGAEVHSAMASPAGDPPKPHAASGMHMTARRAGLKLWMSEDEARQALAQARRESGPAQPASASQAPRTKVEAARQTAGGKVGEAHGGEVEERFERLRTLRLELARAKGWAAFRVFPDATLLEIARVRPRNVRELMEIKGIGPKKVEEFGKELLAELAKG